MKSFTIFSSNLEFFRKNGVHTLTLKTLFDFVTDSNSELPPDRLQNLLANAENIPEADLIVEEEVKFASTFDSILIQIPGSVRIQF